MGATENNTNKDGVSHKVVMDLMEKYQGKGHCVYMDNYCTSPQLLLDLLSKGTYCAGTSEPTERGFQKI